MPKQPRVPPPLPAAITDTMSPTEAARIFGVTADTVRCWIAHGRLPAANYGGNGPPRYRISRAAVLAMFELVETVPGS